MNKKLRLRLFSAGTFLLGALLIAYPFLSDWSFRLEKDKVVERHEAAVSAANPESLDEEWERARAYNERLLQGRAMVTDPFDPGQNTGVSAEEYESVLNLAGDSIMGSLVIPCIDVDLPIYHGTGDDALESGVGHLETTAVPSGGPSTHCVLAGHTGLANKRIFDRLDQMRVNDWFVIRVLGEDHAYRVSSVEVVLPEETDSLVVVPGEDIVTLVTCTPYGVNTHRLLVHAKRCPIPKEWEDYLAGRNEDAFVNEDGRWGTAALVRIGVAAGLGMLVVFALVKRSRRRDK